MERSWSEIVIIITRKDNLSGMRSNKEYMEQFIFVSKLHTPLSNVVT